MTGTIFSGVLSHAGTRWGFQSTSSCKEPRGQTAAQNTRPNRAAKTSGRMKKAATVQGMT